MVMWTRDYFRALYKSAVVSWRSWTGRCRGDERCQSLSSHLPIITEQPLQPGCRRCAAAAAPSHLSATGNDLRPQCMWWHSSRATDCRMVRSTCESQVKLCDISLSRDITMRRLVHSTQLNSTINKRIGIHVLRTNRTLTVLVSQQTINTK